MSRDRSTAIGRVVVLGVILSCSGCGRPEPRRVADGPNVVVFLVDTYRADRLGVYGHEGGTTPYIDALADESVVFESSSSPAPWTLPSVASLMVSSFLVEHGVIRDGDTIDPNVPTLASRMKELGYSTGSIFHNPYAGPMSGLDKGFDVCRQAKRQVGVDHLEDWLDEDPTRPYFLYLHNTLPHDPYRPEAEFLERFGEVPSDEIDAIAEIQDEYRTLTRGNRPRLHSPKNPDTSPQQTIELRKLDARADAIVTLYEAEVSQTDAMVREVVEELKAGGEWDETLFLLISDHGEELGDHGGWEHDHSVYQELVHVPFIVKFPRGEFAGTRLSTPVSLVDVMPTLLDYLGRADLAATCRGRSLMPLVREGDPPASELDEGEPRVTSYRLNKKKYYRPWAETRGDENVVVRQGRWKAIWNVDHDTVELYDLASDPGETRELSGVEPERADALRAFASAKRSEYIAAYTLRESSDVPLSPEQLEALRELGYVDDE